MIINLKEIPPIIHQNFYGGDKEVTFHMVQDEHNKILQGTLIPGASIGFHTHTGNCEIVYIISGKGHVLYDGKILEIKSGECHYCPQGSGHSLRNDGEEDLVFFAVVAKQI